MSDYAEIPKGMQLLMTFINRIGFPIFAFIMMFLLSFFVMWKGLPVIIQIDKTLVLLNDTIGKATETSEAHQLEIIKEINRLDVPRRR